MWDRYNNDTLEYIPGGVHIWIGAYDKYSNDVFYWLDGTRVSGYTNWDSGEPDEGVENRVCISGNNMKWSDSKDIYQRYYLCEVVH